MKRLTASWNASSSDIPCWAAMTLTFWISPAGILVVTFTSAFGSATLAAPLFLGSGLLRTGRSPVSGSSSISHLLLLLGLQIDFPPSPREQFAELVNRFLVGFGKIGGLKGGETLLERPWDEGLRVYLDGALVHKSLKLLKYLRIYETCILAKVLM